MSGDTLCLGMCMMDWDQGYCLGCGRSAEEIHGSSDTEAESDTAETAQTPAAPSPTTESKDDQ